MAIARGRGAGGPAIGIRRPDRGAEAGPARARGGELLPRAAGTRAGGRGRGEAEGSTTMKAEASIQLRKDLARHLRAGHPWVFRKAIERPAKLPAGTIVDVEEEGRFVARGYFDPALGHRGPGADARAGRGDRRRLLAAARGPRGPAAPGAGARHHRLPAPARRVRRAAGRRGRPLRPHGGPEALLGGPRAVARPDRRGAARGGRGARRASSAATRSRATTTTRAARPRAGCSGAPSRRSGSSSTSTG